MKQSDKTILQNNPVREYFDHQAGIRQFNDGEKDLLSIIKQQQQDYILGFIDKLNLKKGSRALDLGCGEGLMSAKLLQRGFEVVAVDFSEKMLELAIKHCVTDLQDKKISFLAENVEELDLQANSFDIVIATGLIEYLKFDRWMLQVMCEFLKPGGTLIIAAPNLISLTDITDPIRIFSLSLQVMRKLLIRFGGRKLFNRMKYYRFGSKVTRDITRNNYLPSRLHRWFEEIDCKIINFNSHGFGPFRLVGKSTIFSMLLHKLFQKSNDKKTSSRLSRLGNDYIIFGQKINHPSELTQRYIFNNMGKRARDFESHNRSYFTRLDAWLQKNPNYIDLPLKELEIKASVEEKVLVISPHPDDELIGCGGTMIKMLEKGAKVAIIQLTDGCSTEALNDAPAEIRHSIRFEEAKIVAEKLGVNDLFLWKINGDEGLKCTENNVKQLTKLLEKYQPKFVFTPFINDIHMDHVVANDLLVKSIVRTSLDHSRIFVLSYEVWSKVPANVYCIIDQQFEKKSKLSKEYRTGMKIVNYVFKCQSWNQYHAWKLLNRKGFAEVFLQLNGKAFVKFIQETNRLL